MVRPTADALALLLALALMLGCIVALATITAGHAGPLALTAA